jgi:RNA polymerase sigma-70 factor (ECF subfamily)
LANANRSSTRRTRLGDRLRHELSATTQREPADIDEAEAVRAAIRKLPEAQREVLLLNAWEGLEPTEIAAVIGVLPTTARTRLRRARNRLRRELEAMGTVDTESRLADVPVIPATREERA